MASALQIREHITRGKYKLIVV